MRRSLTPLHVLLVASYGGVFACGSDSGSSYEPVDVAAMTAGDESATQARATPIAPPPDYDGPLDGFDVYRVPVSAAQPQRGPEDALVTIVTFSDFQCPFCSRVVPTLARILEEYAGQVRLVWRNNPLPFHQQAEPAAQAALEAFSQGGPAEFWEMHDLLFANQRALERQDLERYAAQVGLDVPAFRRALDGHVHAAAIEADQQLSASLGARGTPAFFVNGEQLMGAQPYEAFDEVVRRQLTLAHRAMQQGIPPAAVYAHLTRNGLTAPAPSPSMPNAPPPSQPDPAAIYRVPIDGPAPQRGPDDALVTIVTFSDFQCPFCGRVKPTIDAVLDRYGNDVRLVWMNNPLPFHQNAMPAAEAALEAFAQNGNTGFWAMHDRIFDHQQEITRANLETWAGEVGLNLPRFRSALDQHTHQATIEAQQALTNGLGASGTPTFFINGRNLRGAQPEAQFAQIIDEELTRARAIVQSGTPRAQVYAAAIRDGATRAQTIGGPPPQAAAPPEDHDYGIAVPRRAPARGARRAPVVIQVFSDFQCPFCDRVRPTLDTLLQEYEGRVRLVWRDYPLPFHDRAHLAAEAAREVFRQGGDAAFWAYHDVLFAHQQELELEQLVAHADGIRGVNARQLRRALEQRTHEEAVDADIEAVTDSSARIGTPSFFINGRLLQGAQPIEAFRTAVDRELAR